MELSKIIMKKNESQLQTKYKNNSLDSSKYEHCRPCKTTKKGGIMKKTLMFLIPLIILSCGHKTGSSLTENEKEIIKSELQSRMNQIIQSNEMGNFKKSIEPYLDYPEFIIISNGQISDYNNFIITNEQYFEALKFQKFSESTFTYTFLNSENVIITWGCTALVQMRNEQEIKINPYTATFIFKKVNDLWKVIYAHGSGVYVPIVNSSTQTK